MTFSRLNLRAIGIHVIAQRGEGLSTRGYIRGVLVFIECIQGDGRFELGAMTGHEPHSERLLQLVAGIQSFDEGGADDQGSEAKDERD